MSDATLVIEDLHVSVEDKEILHGVDLVVEPGKVHALMGPNGSGKSTLAYALAGHPRYKVTGGKVTFKGEDVLELTPDERARLGMFLAMQYPVEVPGVSVTNFLRTAVNAVRGEDVPVRQFARDLRDQMKVLEMDPRFAERSLNEGFSGGEKKRHEILQMALLRPRLAILDETDSGLDIDALNTVAHGVNTVAAESDLGVLIITHYQRILHMVQPDRVSIMFDGRIVKQGGSELVEQLEREGYGWVREEAATA